VSSDQYTPAQVVFPSDSEDAPIAFVSAGERHTLFLDTIGRVYSCGSNEFGQLGIQNKKFEF